MYMASRKVATPLTVACWLLVLTEVVWCHDGDFIRPSDLLRGSQGPVDEILRDEFRCPSEQKATLMATCPEGTFQSKDRPLPCFNGNGCFDKDIRKGGIEDIVDLPVGAMGVSLTMMSNADLDMHLMENGECIVGYKCKFALACPKEDLSLLKGHRCIDYLGQEMFFSGDDTFGPVIEESFEIDEVKHNTLKLEVEGYAAGEGVAFFKYTSFPDCTATRPHGCSACEDWKDCDEGFVPKCDGSKIVSCVNATTAKLTAMSDKEPEKKNIPWAWIVLAVVGWGTATVIAIMLLMRRANTYKALSCDPMAAAKAKVESALEAVLTQNIEFETQSAKLTAVGRNVVEEIAGVLAESPNMEINIEGHCACTCHAGCKNVQLSDDRCISVKQTLQDMGCKNEFFPQGFGCQMRIGKKVKVFPR